MANLINLRKFSNYKTISVAQLIFLTTISFMDTYFYFSNEITESKTVKESLKQSIIEKHIFAISPKNYNYLYFLLKKINNIFLFFQVPSGFNLDTRLFTIIAFRCTTAFFSSTAFPSTTAFFFTTPFYFFTMFHYTALLH